MTDNRVPINYQTPAFPSLYDPFPRPNAAVYYLYYTRDIWRFTLYWTLIFYLASHLSVAAWALAMQGRSWRICIAIPLVYGIIAGLEALLAGSIIGLVLGSVYEAGNFRMSTWIPMIWGGINMLVLILSSFPMQGGL
ncbi:integral membrane protein [Aspergillus bombycis]|uniref:Integral membrane protein n=9 Tax=Aspergillus TaxID=5052 RepID=A0A2G7FJI4_9EURO|nr:integral membrane protein [Aspergillus bombycis]XP_031914357.1 uncharacterized protein BDV38DRAFT_282295 [Aspergillus pseudotamarii]XP_031922870.1 uncharacterized protein BDV27DRAFT_49782 [Aspergillus caelatus]KAB8201965.1 integral membrane protein [Aspergillus parasiticus]KAE8163079.1 integral membrane protein [Aspergillus tamarii]KAE8307729.1 integral membrane protein [Aspergillus transmontanensis]KAE8329323.1 integral membrane protein [Aspergillus sergii]KAE8335856.1 hypothetical prote